MDNPSRQYECELDTSYLKSRLIFGDDKLNKMKSVVKIKKEHFVDSDRNFCTGCLSSDRELKLLGEYSDIYRRICPNSLWKMDSKIHFCWECRATLRKVKYFQEKVENAQKILNSWCDGENPLSLSNLLPSQTKIAEYCENLEVNEEENKIKVSVIENNTEDDLKPEIKQEIEIEYHDDGGGDDFNYEPIDMIKEENLTSITSDTLLKQLKDITVKKSKISTKSKKLVCERTKHYKMKHQKLKDKDLVRRIEIDDKDIEMWVEKERNSNYYKSLKNKCDKCVSTIRVMKLQDHNKAVHLKTRDKKMKCNICEQYLTPQGYRAHKPMHSYYHQCKTCGYECYNKFNMRNHLYQHKKVVQCLYCPGIFVNTRKFYVHLNYLHKFFVCDYCNKKYRKLDALERHITRKHMSKSPNKCTECDIVFNTPRTYREHCRMKHHTERTEAAYCVQCDKQFNNVILFKRHVRNDVAHSAEWTKKPRKTEVQCPSCPNVYTRRTFMLNHHRFVHENRPKYYCEQCHKGFLTSTNWKNHQMYTHEGLTRQKNKICYICGRGFSTNKILTHHLRTHTGERPYACPHCDAKFAQQTAMFTHVRFIHEKNKRKR